MPPKASVPKAAAIKGSPTSKVVNKKAAKTKAPRAPKKTPAKPRAPRLTPEQKARKILQLDSDGHLSFVVPKNPPISLRAFFNFFPLAGWTWEAVEQHLKNHWPRYHTMSKPKKEKEPTTEDQANEEEDIEDVEIDPLLRPIAELKKRYPPVPSDRWKKRSFGKLSDRIKQNFFTVHDFLTTCHLEQSTEPYRALFELRTSFDQFLLTPDVEQKIVQVLESEQHERQIGSVTMTMLDNANNLVVVPDADLQRGELSDESSSGEEDTELTDLPIPKD